MKIYDITQELFSAKVFDGDKSPNYTIVKSIQNGDDCNLSDISLCTHNGTHIDAPSHFLPNGITVDNVLLEKCYGECTVVDLGGLADEQVEAILNKTKKRLLIKGNYEVTQTFANLICKCGVFLVGVESQSVGNFDNCAHIHKILLEYGIVILEGLNLDSINEGDYILSALPLKLGGLDGSPVRAVLIK